MIKKKSDSKQVATTIPGLSKIVKPDASVNMESIVAFFISKYENNLLETKKTLYDKMATLNTWLNKEFMKEVEKEISLDSYRTTIDLLGIETDANIQIDVQDVLKNKKVSIYIFIKDNSKGERYNRRGNTLSVWKDAALSDTLHTKFTNVYNELETLRSTLEETLEKLSTVSRKEREIRGALAEKTLRDAGVGGLFDDQSLLDLVSLPALSMKTLV